MKKYLFSIFFSIQFSVLLLGQETFNKIIDFELHFEALTGILPTDSCYYATGVALDTTSPASIANIFTKFDLEGNIEFTKKISSPGKSYEIWTGSLMNIPNGNFLDVGYTIDSVMKALIIEYSPNGDTVKTKEFLNPHYPEDTFIGGRAIESLTNGGFALVVGHTLQDNGDAGLFILDSLLNPVNFFEFGTNLTEIPWSLLVEEDGGFIVGSIRQSLNSFSTDPKRQTYLIKFDSLGNVSWTKPSSWIQLRDNAKTMIGTDDGGVIIASGVGIEDEINATASQVDWYGMIFKLDADRNLFWEREFRGLFPSPNSGLSKMVESSDGSGYVAVGRVVENVSAPETKFGSYIVKVSPEGDSLWARYYTFFDGIESRPHPHDLELTSDGGFIICGEIQLFPIDTSLQLAWLLKVDEHGCLVPGCHIIDEVEEPSDLDFTLKLYPNPTSDFLNIFLRSHKNLQTYEFRIRDVSGHLVRQLESYFPEETLMVSLEDVATGIYFLEVWQKAKLLQTTKFIVQR